MTLVSDLGAAGFSTKASLRYDDAVAIAPGLAAAFRGSALLLVVCNQSDLWPHFVRAYRADPALQAAPDPFDAFVEATLTPIVADRPVRYAHRRYDDAYLPMQRVAAAARLGVISKTQLLIHDACGPWISLRAVVGLHPQDGWAGSVGIASWRCPPTECKRTCVPLFDTATERGALATWRDWVAVRDACSSGKPWRFSDEQIIYHYTHDRRVIGTGVTLATYVETAR